MSDVDGGIADLRPLVRAQEQKAWYFYDWANSAFATTIAGVLFGPYLIAIAEEAAVDDRVSVLGIAVAPGALPAYVITFSTLISALVLPLLGAVADRTARKKDMLAGFAWTGSFFAALLFFMTGDNWQLGAITFVLANLCFGASAVFNDAILPLISDESERDRVSTRGWAYGYAGGGLLLALNFVLVSFHDTFGLTEGMAVRISLLSAAVWWAAFTFIPWRGLQNHPPVHVEQVEGGVLQRSFGQLLQTLKDMRNYPVALTFLLAYLFFNDGIQTVISQASVYGVEELGFPQGTMLGVYLLVQFVAVGGALLFGRIAAVRGAKSTILGGLVVWMLIVTAALFIPEESLLPLLALGVAIGIVLGGTQALARSYFSLLIPRGKEAEYFSFYHAMERGTSWFGTLVFGLVYTFTDSYRPAIFALIIFFVVGGLLLMRVDTARGIRDAGNDVPAVI
ncbi:MFS transporter [Nocardioides sp. zg-1308]|uniref:MFS transporter n=1 Tax=Nocardioides renjunii TaxID=3095075 RepID=A0ABU5KAV1_9ACTN|nr:MULTISPECIES: MFS transporter [unclassified Nocardioides]MDZ5662088.1 MFS transporter [Nocardioides sp. S-58]NPD06204.1 MFS transporter [Nocardioides sp. zg-1308]WQQ24327.1 MFS transporter [Nocardioides sp. S-34]